MPDKKSNFEFIEEEILRSNLDITFDLVVALNTLADSQEHSFSDFVRSGFRKMVIVNTSSIIEALLLYLLKKSKSENDLATKKIAFKELDLIHQIEGTSLRIVKGHDVESLVPCNLKKLNLDGLIKLCKEHQIIIDPVLLKDLGDVRDLRNRQHIGTLEVIDGGYSKKELEFVFKVAKLVKQQAKQNYSKTRQTTEQGAKPLSS